MVKIVRRKRQKGTSQNINGIKKHVQAIFIWALRQALDPAEAPPPSPIPSVPAKLKFLKHRASGRTHQFLYRCQWTNFKAEFINTFCSIQEIEEMTNENKDFFPFRFSLRNAMSSNKATLSSMPLSVITNNRMWYWSSIWD